MMGKIETLRFEDRAIHVYTPPSYETGGQYPAVYIQDGSYLFHDCIERLEDDFLNGVTQETVFVGIEPNDRYTEYTPWPAPYLRPTEPFVGGGDQYLEFLAESVMPFIQSRYRVTADPAQTGMAGGSLGALISLVGALKKPDHIRKIALMSASFWYPEALAFLERSEFRQERVRVYMYVGELEAKGRGNIQEQMVPNTRIAYAMLQRKLPGGNRDVKFETDPEGVHTHDYFASYFPNAMRFLYPKA